jgi:GH25 family lysozyme M1 (1,4-beta-N-acetylmuramidase)
MEKKMKKSLLMLLVLCLCLAACGRSDQITSTEPDYIIDEEDENTEPPVLYFVDAHGEWHDFYLNEDVPKNEYDIRQFKLDGDRMSYGDSAAPCRLGVDVSHHQGKINWKKVAKDGIDFAILRIGYRGYGQAGTLNPDKQFEANYKGAKAAGLDVGVYFFAQAINEEEAREEAEFVLELLGDRELDLPIVYDPESILDDDARTDNVTGDQFTANSAEFCKTIREAGYEPMIYANMVWEAYELDLSKLSDIPIWYADYEVRPQTPYDFKIWQYTCQGKVAGITGGCDINIMM